MLYTNTKSTAVKVWFKVAGKEYGTVTEAADKSPFDEVIVEGGASAELGDAVVTKVIDMASGLVITPGFSNSDNLTAG